MSIGTRLLRAMGLAVLVIPLAAGCGEGGDAGGGAAGTTDTTAPGDMGAPGDPAAAP